MKNDSRHNRHQTGKRFSKRRQGKTSHGEKTNAPLRLYGLHTVREALLNPQRTKYKLLSSANAMAKLKDALKLCSGLEIEEIQPRQLDKMVGGDAVHQGVLLECAPLNPLSIDDIEPGELIVVLDQISDPHNVGAIMRSCVAFGAGSLLITARNSAAQTAVLAKSASGALEHIKLIEISNLSKAVNQLNEMGYQSIGLDSEGPQIMEDSLDGRPLAIVLGAEGRGLREKTRETCTTLARLDMPGKIRSLNVSNAAALALYIASKK